MSQLRKMTRKLLLHDTHRCKCGGNAKFFKDLPVVDNKTHFKRTLHNVFYCKQCGKIFELTK